MKEICGLETKYGTGQKDSGLEQMNAYKSEEQSHLLPLEALKQNSLADAINALFEFIETELEVPDAKQE